MSVAFVSASVGRVNPGTSITFSHTVAAGSDRCLIVFAAATGGSVDVTGVTFNGVAMTQHSAFDSNATKSYKLVAPDVGTFDVVVSLQSSIQAAAIACDFTGVDQTTPADAATTSFGSTGPTISSATDDMPVAFMWDAGGPSSITPTQTEFVDSLADSLLVFGQRAAGAASVAMTYSSGGGGFNSPRNTGFNLNAAAGGGSDNPLAHTKRYGPGRYIPFGR